MSNHALPYPERLPLAHLPSPFESLRRLPADVGGPPIWVKRDDMTGLEMTGNKARKLEFLLADARKEGCDTLVTAGGIQSNHCRATAAAGARVGMGVRLLLRGVAPEGVPDGNLFLNHLFGAEVRHYPSEEFVARKKEIIADNLDELRAAGRKPYYFPIGGSVPVAMWGYVKCLEEIRDQARAAGVQPRHVVAACGSGGTVAGLILGRALLGWRDLTVWGVSVAGTEPFWKDDIASMLRETRQKYALDLTDGDLPVSVPDAYVGPGYAIPYPEEIEVIRRVARLEGLLLDPVYTGKAMTGLLDLIRKGRIGRDEPVVFVHTGGVFGLFPQREALWAKG